MDRFGVKSLCKFSVRSEPLLRMRLGESFEVWGEIRKGEITQYSGRENGPEK